jgi:hypothetical protein
MHKTETETMATLEAKGWVRVAIKKGVEIYTKTTPFSTKFPDVEIQHVAFKKDNHWYNYCYPSNMYWYLDEYLEFFLAECDIKDHWKQMLKEMDENELGFQENDTRLV